MMNTVSVVTSPRLLSYASKDSTVYAWDPPAGTSDICGERTILNGPAGPIVTCASSVSSAPWESVTRTATVCPPATNHV